MTRLRYILELRKRKLIKRTLFVLVGFVGLIILLLTVLQLYLQSHKATFLAEANKKLSSSLEGKVEIKDLNINVWKHFPNAGIYLENVTISDSLYNRPLLKVKTIIGQVSLIKLITKKVNIRSVTLADGQINLFTDKSGYTNQYILSAKKNNTDSGNDKLDIDEVKLENINVVSEHAIKNKWFGVLFHQLKANITRSDSLLNISMSENATIKGLGFNLDKGYYLKDKTVAADWNLHFNTGTKELSFKETPVKIDDQPFTLQGNFYLIDTLRSKFKLIVQTKGINYKAASSLLPANIQKKTSLVQLTKPIDLYGVIEGPMAYRTIPHVNVQWTVIKNEVVTPITVLKDCDFIGSFTNEKIAGLPRTDENSEIILAGFSANWEGVLLAGTNIVVTNLLHPTLRFKLTSKTTLQALDDKFALPSIRLVGGSALLDLQYDGPLVGDVSMLKKLSGKLDIQNGEVTYEPRQLTFNNCNGEILFSETDLLVKKFTCDLNKNHFEVEVAGDNVGSLAFKDPAKSAIICNVYSPSVDLGDFKVLFSSKRNYVRRKQSKGFIQSTRQVEEVLEKGTLELRLKAGMVQLDKFQAKSVSGNIAFKNNNWALKDVSLLHADGKMEMSGEVEQINEDFYQAASRVKLQGIDVKKLFYAFDNFGQDAVTSTNLKGILNSNGDIKAGIDNKGNLVPNSLEGHINFSLKQGALIHFEPLQRLQAFIFKNRDLSKVEFAEIKNRFDIKKDQIYINRMEIQSSILTLFVEGIYSLKDNTDISIQVPWSNLRKRPENYKPKNEGTDKKVGPSIYLRARTGDDGKIKIGFDVFRKLRKNKFKEQFEDLKQ